MVERRCEHELTATLCPFCPPKKPTVPEVLPIVNALYARHGAGCCWHIVLDDQNVDRDSVDFCVKYHQESDCNEPECDQLCELLPKMSATQIRKLSAGHT